jgi:hypothetical protein
MVDAGSACPGRHLLDAGGAEGVGRDDHRFSTLLLESVCELANRGCFSRAVYSVNHNSI